MLGGSAFFICQISAKSLFSQVLGAKLVFWGLVFVLGFSNFEKSTEILSENFSLMKSRFKARALYLYWGKALWLWSKLEFSLRISVDFFKLENLRTNTSPQKTSLAPRTCENKDLTEIWQIKKAEPPSISSRTLPLKFKVFFQALSEDDLSSWQDKSSSQRAESQ